MKLQLEKDYGIYAHSAVKKEVLTHGDRYTRACDSFGYEFDVNGLSRTAPAGSGMAHAFQTKVTEVLAEKYPLSAVSPPWEIKRIICLIWKVLNITYKCPHTSTRRMRSSPGLVS